MSLLFTNLLIKIHGNPSRTYNFVSQEFLSMAPNTEEEASSNTCKCIYQMINPISLRISTLLVMHHRPKN